MNDAYALLNMGFIKKTKKTQKKARKRKRVEAESEKKKKTQQKRASCRRELSSPGQSPAA